MLDSGTNYLVYPPPYNFGGNGVGDEEAFPPFTSAEPGFPVLDVPLPRVALAWPLWVLIRFNETIRVRGGPKGSSRGAPCSDGHEYPGG